MSPLCHERIILSTLSETYCMLPRGHKGPHSIHLKPVVVVPPAPKVSSTPLIPFTPKGR